MKKIILVISLGLTGCTGSPKKVSPSNAEKITNLTVVNFFGDDMVLKKAAGQQVVKVTGWNFDAEVEKALAKEIANSGRKHIPAKLTTYDRKTLLAESQKAGGNVESMAFALAEKSGAEHALIITPAMSPLFLGCLPKEETPKMETKFRAEIWNLKGKKQVLSAPIVIEAHSEENIKCEDFEKLSDKKILKTFKKVFADSVKQLAIECTTNSGLTKK
jgi:hypothetical protein